jgi:hypothetical protein
MLQRVDGDILGFDRTGDRGDGAVRRGDVLRQIVDHPVRDILDTVQAKQIEGLFGLGEAGAFP